jgi:hypothetical protein
MAVGLREPDRFHRRHPATAAPVLDNDVLTPDRLELLGQCDEDVRRLAGREWHDELDRPARKARLCPCRAGQRNTQSGQHAGAGVPGQGAQGAARAVLQQLAPVLIGRCGSVLCRFHPVSFGCPAEPETDRSDPGRIVPMSSARKRVSVRNRRWPALDRVPRQAPALTAPAPSTHHRSPFDL